MARTPSLLALIKRIPAGDLTKAARAIGLTPSAVLDRVAAVESALGIRVLGNATKALRPTDAGRIVLDHASRIITQARDLTRDLEELAGLQSPALNFGADPYAAEAALGIALGRMASANPRLRVRTTQADFDALCKDVLAGQLEFAVADTTAAERHPTRLGIEPLTEHRLFFFVRAGHPLCEQASPTLAALTEFPLAGTRLPQRVAVHVAKATSGTRVERETGDALPNLAVGSVAVMKSVVLSGDAIGLAPIGALSAELKAGRVALLDFDAPWMRMSYGLFHLRKRPLSRVAQLFLTQLRQVEADLDGQARRALARLEGPARGKRRKAAPRAAKTPRRKSRKTATR